MSLLCDELRLPVVARLRRSRGSAILRTGKISPSKSCSALRRVTAWVACSLPCTWPGLSPSSPLPESSGGCVARFGGLLGHDRRLGLLGDLLEPLAGAFRGGPGGLGHPVLTAPPAMGERKLGRRGGVGGGHHQAVVRLGGGSRRLRSHHLLGFVPGAHGPRRAAHHDVGTMAEGTGVDAHQGDEPPDRRA